MGKVLKKKIYKYTVFFEPAEEGGYVAYVPILEGCVSQGETLEEAREMIKDAIKGYLEVLKAEKDSLPEESEEALISKVEIIL